MKFRDVELFVLSHSFFNHKTMMIRSYKSVMKFCRRFNFYGEGRTPYIWIKLIQALAVCPFKKINNSKYYNVSYKTFALHLVRALVTFTVIVWREWNWLYSFILRQWAMLIMNYTFYLGHYSPVTRTDPVPSHTESSVTMPSQVQFWKSGLLAAFRCHSAQFLKELFWVQEVGLEKNSDKRQSSQLKWELLDCASWSPLLFCSLLKVTCSKPNNGFKVQNQHLKLHLQISHKSLQITKLRCNVFPVGITTVSTHQCSVRCGMWTAECLWWLYLSS